MLERQSIQSEAIALWAPAALGRLISCSFGGAEGIRTPDLRSAIVMVDHLPELTTTFLRLLVPCFIAFAMLPELTGVGW